MIYFEVWAATNLFKAMIEPVVASRRRLHEGDWWETAAVECFAFLLSLLLTYWMYKTGNNGHYIFCSILATVMVIQLYERKCWESFRLSVLISYSWHTEEVSAALEDSWISIRSHRSLSEIAITNMAVLISKSLEVNKSNVSSNWRAAGCYLFIQSWYTNRINIRAHIIAAPTTCHTTASS